MPSIDKLVDEFQKLIDLSSDYLVFVIDTKTLMSIYEKDQIRTVFIPEIARSLSKKKLHYFRRRH